MRLEQLVERPEAAREDHEPFRVLHEHRLSDEEVAELDAQVHPGVEPLLVRQLDVAADREAAGLEAATVRCGHHARPTAGDHREACLGEETAELSRLLVDGFAFGHPCGAEHRHGRPDAGERVEPFHELGLDPQRPPRVRVEKGGSAPPQEPLVGGAGAGRHLPVHRLPPDHEPPRPSELVAAGGDRLAVHRAGARAIRFVGSGRGRGVAGWH